MRKVKWGVLGTAGIAAGQTIPGMQQAVNCHLSAIAGRSMEKARDYQRRFGFDRAYDSYDQLLEDPDIEAVYIPLPNTLHFEWVRKALSHGKHVLCEKPITPTAEEAKELFDTARENGVSEEKYVDVPQNYRLEVEQLGRCITDGEQPHVTESFTLDNLDTIEKILEKTGYWDYSGNH